jgi:hypothetical protein
MAVVHNLHMQVPILIAHIRSSLLNDMIDNIQFRSRPFRLIPSSVICFLVTIQFITIKFFLSLKDFMNVTLKSKS